MTKILIVDDDPALRAVYELLCKKHGWQSITANNGEEGIELLQSESPDFVILDVLMPKMTGIEFLEEVKKLEIKLPPTIVMTNSQVPENTGTLVQSLGAKSYTLKSTTHLDEVADLVKKYLEPSA